MSQTSGSSDTELQSTKLFSDGSFTDLISEIGPGAASIIDQCLQSAEGWCKDDTKPVLISSTSSFTRGLPAPSIISTTTITPVDIAHGQTPHVVSTPLSPAVYIPPHIPQSVPHSKPVHHQYSHMIPHTVTHHSMTPHTVTTPPPAYIQQQSFSPPPTTEQRIPGDFLVPLTVSSYKVEPGVVSPQPQTGYYPSIYDNTSPPSYLRQNSGEFAGDYKFSLEIPEKEKVTKSMTWIHSKPLNRLYIQMGVQCPIRFLITSGDLSHGVRVRASPVYKDWSHRADPVHACHAHSLPQNHHNPHPRIGGLSPWLSVHSSIDSCIDQDPAGHCSITTPWLDPSSDHLEVLYSFSCRNTCVGGPNRRVTNVIFTLESMTGTVLGKQVLEVKVIASPGRDAGKDEKKFLAEQKSLSSLAVPQPRSKIDDTPRHSAPIHRVQKRHNRTPEKLSPPKKFYLEITHQSTYDTLAPIRDALDLAKTLPQHDIDEYKREQIKFAPLQTRCANTYTLDIAPEPSTKKKSTQSCNTQTSSTSMIRSETAQSPTSPTSIQQPDSTERELPSHIDPHMSLAEWLMSFGFDAYTDTFAEAGYTTVGHIINLQLSDMERLKISTAQCRVILDNINTYLRATDILSQPSSGEALGLISIHKRRVNLELSCSSSNED